ncbi:MAG: NAD-dependent deacylase [Candidatus Schekmanbacteria bacterium]|nr:NAD-dependent deacylase [Candidatus Schekmanbacteria bacterium]
MHCDSRTGSGSTERIWSIFDSATKLAAAWLVEAGKAIAVTGAGVSTESGIPDFRSATGLWARFDPQEYATIGAFRKNPEKVWTMLVALEEVLRAEPNAGHRALAALEAEGGIAGIVTQNVDGLHQQAGSSVVVEFHGSHRTFTCLSCGACYAREQVASMTVPPRCTAGSPRARCAAVLKPDVVFFDELIPAPALRDTDRLLAGADLVLVIGTSCEVYPAAAIPQTVRACGGRIVEMNLEPAADLSSDLFLPGPFTRTMPHLLAAWRRQRGR